MKGFAGFNGIGGIGGIGRIEVDRGGGTGFEDWRFEDFWVLIGMVLGFCELHDCFVFYLMKIFKFLRDLLLVQGFGGLVDNL